MIPNISGPRAAATPQDAGVAHQPRHRADPHDRRGRAGRGRDRAQHVRSRGRLDPGLLPLQQPRHTSRTRQRSSRPPTAIDYTFNWFYTDDRDIAYFSSGRLPRASLGHRHRHAPLGRQEVRPAGLAQRRQARATDQPADGLPRELEQQARARLRRSDDKWADGSVHRSQALSDRCASGDRCRQGRGGPSWPASSRTPQPRTYERRRSCRSCSRCSVTIPRPRARSLLSAWLATVPTASTASARAYAHQAAIRIFDSWWEDGEKSVAYDFVRRLGPLARALPQPSTITHAAVAVRRGSARLGTATSTRSCASCLGRTVRRLSRTTAARSGPCRTTCGTSARARSQRVPPTRE